jgi:hypothetical protein
MAFAKLVGAGPVRPVFCWVRSDSVHESVWFPPLNGAYNFYLSVNRPVFLTVGTGPPAVRLTLVMASLFCHLAKWLRKNIILNRAHTATHRRVATLARYIARLRVGPRPVVELPCRLLAWPAADLTVAPCSSRAASWPTMGLAPVPPAAEWNSPPHTEFTWSPGVMDAPPRAGHGRTTIDAPPPEPTPLAMDALRPEPASPDHGHAVAPSYSPPPWLSRSPHCRWSSLLSVRNMVPTLTSRKRRGLSLNGRC